MKVVDTIIDGVKLLEPQIFFDSRGYFFESFSQREFESKIGKINFVQDNESMSSYGVIRGLHNQSPPFAQSKLVRCVKGAVLDIAVDIRKGSSTYGQHVSCLLASGDIFSLASTPSLRSIPEAELRSAMHRQLFIPKGFAHGFSVLSEIAVFQYKCDEFYHPESIVGFSPLDDNLNIDWKISTINALVSERDAKLASFKDFDSPFV